MTAEKASTTSFDDLLHGLRPFLQLLDRLHNLVTVCVDDEIIYLNPHGASLLGLDDAKSALNRSFSSFVHRDYAELAALGLSIFAEETSLISMKLVRQDGTDIDVELWVNCVGQDGVYLIEAHDITEHLRAARALRLREQRLEGIINTVADGVLTVDDTGIIQTFNPAAESIFGFTKEEVVGRNIRALIPDALFEGADDVNGAPLRKPGSAIAVTGKRKSGDVVDLEVAMRSLQQGEEISFTGILRDVTARKAAEARIFNMAHHDALTGLPNRYLFTDRVEEAFKRAKRNRQRFALFFVDLDKFKPINDTYGHAVGDEVLKEVANRLKGGVRTTDTVARVGGDEFLVLVEDLSTPDDIEELRRKLQGLLSRPLQLPTVNLSIGASLGVAIYPDDATDIDSLMNHADSAMYKTKHQR
jgi:diguanylate cyclase (GGDEF)-like protein/PAS domain S-box-containing protein